MQKYAQQKCATAKVPFLMLTALPSCCPLCRKPLSNLVLIHTCSLGPRPNIMVVGLEASSALGTFSVLVSCHVIKNQGISFTTQISGTAIRCQSSLTYSNISWDVLSSCLRLKSWVVSKMSPLVANMAILLQSQVMEGLGCPWDLLGCPLQYHVYMHVVPGCGIPGMSLGLPGMFLGLPNI